MRSPLLGMVCLAASSAQALWTPSLQSRQANSIVDKSLYLRRGYHSSAVFNRTVYIDGGEFTYSSGGSIVYDYSSNMIAISLEEDWTNATVTLESISKPSGVPNLSNGGIWVDEERNVLYTGFAGRLSKLGEPTFQPNGLWEYSPASDSWKNLNSTVDVFGDNYNRPDDSHVATGNGKGYSLGGLTGGFASNGLTTYDFTTHELTNTSVPLESIYNGSVLFGRMQFVPNFGPSGVIVSVGGHHAKGQENEELLITMDVVQIFDPETGKWYEQPVSGDIPTQRQEFCLAGVASQNNTYEIFLYGGWGGGARAGAIPFDSAYVLTLPGFHWIQASFPAAHPRHSFTCESVGGGQILTIGGLDTTKTDTGAGYKGAFQTPDPFVYGLGIFDISTFQWKHSFLANQTVYTPTSRILEFYEENDRLAAFENSDLKALFSVQNFTGVPTSPPSNPSATGSTHSGGVNSPATATASAPATATTTTSSSSGGSSHSTNAGAIAGGVVGGVAGVALIAAGAFFLLRRRQPQQPSFKSTELEGTGYDKGYNQIYRGPTAFTELSGTGGVVKHELPGVEPTRYELGPP